MIVGPILAVVFPPGHALPAAVLGEPHTARHADHGPATDPDREILSGHRTG